MKALSDVAEATGARAKLAARDKPEASKTNAKSRFMLGLFAVVGLARVNVLIADYGTAADLLSLVLDFGSRNGSISKSRACFVAVHYYTGFSQIMLRRYRDAIASLSPAVLKIRRAQVNSGGGGVKDKKYEQMVSLLALAVTLSPGPPQRMNRDVSDVLDFKCRSQMEAMRASDGVALRQFESLFNFACPAFVSPVAPSSSAGGPAEDLSGAAKEQQTAKFMREMRRRQRTPQIRSFLRLYRSVSLEKLAGLQRSRAAAAGDRAAAERTNAETLRQQLVCLKHRASASGPSVGAVGAARNVHFWIDGDTVHVDEQPRPRHFGGFFMSHMEKFNNILSASSAR
jgi:translation initiation factor 3 subunit L